MKKTLLLTNGIFFLVFFTAFCQEQGKSSLFRNHIGIQFNPYINQQFFNFKIMNTVFALRYGYRITKNITTGMEFSCVFPINMDSGQSLHYFGYGIGLLTRYSFLSERRFQIFAEASPYYKHSNTDGIKDTDYKFNQFGVYVAPGVSLYSKSKKFSFDLYYKFSNLTLVNGKKSVLSYKINYFF